MAEEKLQFKDQTGKSNIMIDGDTFVDQSGKRTRIDGINAPEVDKLIINDDGETEYISGQVGSDEMTNAIAKIIKEGNFTNKHVIGKDDSDGNRDLANLYNEDGQELAEQLYRSGVVDVNDYTTAAQMNAKKEGRLLRALYGNDSDPYFDIGEKVEHARIKEQIEQGVYFKPKAIDERFYDEEYHDDVMLRDHSRTIDNKAKGTLQGAKIALLQGLEGIKEGLFGYADAISATTDSEHNSKWMQNWARKGMDRSHERMANAPKIVLGFEDVESLTTGFQYLLNNAAMSAPYLVTTFGAFAASAPITGILALRGMAPITARKIGLGLTMMPNSLIYAGQTWNEMDRVGYDLFGNKRTKGMGEFIAASTSGVLQASLERLGVGALLPKGALLTKAAEKKVIEQLKTKTNPLTGLRYTQEQAAEAFKRVLGKEQADFARGLGTIIDADDIRRFSPRDLIQTAGAGAFGESVTELAQEGTQMGTAVAFSDTQYDPSEVANRLMNAGLAGATLGGAIGAAGSAYTQGKREMARADIKKGKNSRYGIVQRFRNMKTSLGERIKTVKENIKEKDLQSQREIDSLNPNDEDTTVIYDENGVGRVVIVEETNSKGEATKIRELGYEFDNKGVVRNKDGSPKLAVSKTIDPKNKFEINPFDIATRVLANNPKFKEFHNIIKKVIPTSTLSAAANEDLNKLKEKLTKKRKSKGLNVAEKKVLKAIDSVIEARTLNKPVADNTPPLKTKFDKMSDNTLYDSAQSYIKDDKGVFNTFRNAEGFFDLMSSAAQGFSKLFRAAMNVAIPMERLVQSPIALDIYSRVTGMAMNVYHAGKSFKEYNDSLIAGFKSYVDEIAIANLLGYKNLNIKNVKEISAKLIAFGTPTYDSVTNKITKISDFNKMRFFIALKMGLGIKAYEYAIKKQEKRATLDDEKVIRSEFELVGLKFDDDYEYFIKEVINLSPKRRRNESSNSIIGRINQFLEDFKNNEDPTIYYNDIKEYQDAQKLYVAALQIKNSYDAIFEKMKLEYEAENKREIGQGSERALKYNPDYWWQHQGFDWKEVRRNPDEFKNWLRSIKTVSYTEEDINRIYEGIARDGEDFQLPTDFSLVGGVDSNGNKNKAWRPWSFTPAAVSVTQQPGFDRWSSKNIFENLNKSQIEVAKYVSVTNYFGEGGWKLNKLFNELKKEGILSEKEINQFAYYTKSVIDSTHGNFNRINNPIMAALNKYLTGWSILTGLPLSAISSFPETAMIYFNIKDDKDFRKASDTLIREFGRAFDKALNEEVKTANQLVKQLGLAPSQNTVVDRLATGQRDVSFMRLHETFFKAIGIQQITQFQRRLAAGFGISFLESSFQMMDYAPRFRYIDTSQQAFDYQVSLLKQSLNIPVNTSIKDLKGDLKKKFMDGLKDLKSERKKNIKYNKDNGLSYDDGSPKLGLDDQGNPLSRDGELDISNFNEIELRTYNMLTELGIDVVRVDMLMQNIDENLRPYVFNITDSQSVLEDGAEDPSRAGVMKDPDEYFANLTARETALSQVVNNRLEGMEEKDVAVGSRQIVNHIKELEAEVNEIFETALYRFTNERVQLPGAANRPLFFQDPHYQIMTQFNGFISTFTANVIPKLYNNNIRKGTIKTKYDTFALLVMMIALGGASQYLKDLIKFGKPSPYMDTQGYIQRAMYSSGVLGQYERLVDLAVPLYPDRDKGLEKVATTILGEAGPGIRNVQNVVSSTGQLLEGDVDRGLANLFRSAPIIAPSTQFRRGAADLVQGENPIEGTSISQYLFGN